MRFECRLGVISIALNLNFFTNADVSLLIKLSFMSYNLVFDFFLLVAILIIILITVGVIIKTQILKYNDVDKTKKLNEQLQELRFQQNILQDKVLLVDRFNTSVQKQYFLILEKLLESINT